MSGIDLDETDLLLLDTVDRLAASRLHQFALDADADRCFPRAALNDLADHDLLTIGIPATAGGVGGSVSTALRVVERLAATSPVLAALPATFLVTAAAGAGAAQLPAMMTGHTPDRAGLVVAERAGSGHWTLDGFMTGVQLAEVCTDLVVTARDSDGSVLVARLPADSPGVAVGPQDRRTGLRGSASAKVDLTAVRVTDADVVGGPAEAAAAIRCQALCGAATALGLTRAVLAASVRYLGSRMQFGVALSTFSGLGATVARHWSALDATTARLWATCPPTLADLAAVDLATCLDLARSTAASAVDASLDAIQLHGGYGYISDQPVERLFRDAVSVRAAHGGSASPLALDDLNLA